MPMPVINLAQMRQWERATWATGQTEAMVIRRVGQAIAARVRELTVDGDLIVILAGKGHNGDDARAVGKHLKDRKFLLCNISEPAKDFSKLKTALSRGPALIIDGLFGIGLNRSLEDGWQTIIRLVNESNLPVLAVDVPSGLNAENGESFGAAIKAAFTLTVGVPKTGLLAEPAWPFVGRLEVLNDVGLIPCPHQSALNWLQPEDFRHFPPRRMVAGHKGTFGHLAIIGGSLGYHGAAVLAARAAQRAQPGLLTVFTDENVYLPVAAQLQAAMVNVFKPAWQLPESTSGVLAGPGLAARGMTKTLKASVGNLWRRSSLPMVVDASALDWLPRGKCPHSVMRVITPHPGETARMLGVTPQTVQRDRVGALRELSGCFGDCWVVLKGHQTLIGRSTGEIFINCSGNPHLAQGGAGDVLGGYIGGLLAQPVLQSEPAKTICYAVWRHGMAADQLQATGANWVVEDLITELGRLV